MPSLLLRAGVNLNAGGNLVPRGDHGVVADHGDLAGFLADHRARADVRVLRDDRAE